MSAVSPGIAMTTAGTGITEERPVPSQLTLSVLESAQSRQTLTTLSSLVRTSYGPNGHLKLLHNNTRGHVTMTSSSGRLLSSLPVSSPIVKLILSAVNQHMARFGDGGLFTTLLTLTLIERSLESDIQRHLTVNIYEFLLKQSLQYIECDAFTCKHSIDFSSLTQITTLVKSILATKTGCGLQVSDIEQISQLLVEAFLRSIPAWEKTSRNLGSVQILGLEGRPPIDSSVRSGVLVETPQIPIYAQHPLELKPDSTSDTVRVALFNISLAGDGNEHLDEIYEIEGEDLCDEDVLLADMTDLAARLIDLQVRLVLCQKVIHPSLKKVFRVRGVLVLDRIGIGPLPAIHQLTGGRIISSIHMSVTEADLGQLQSARHLVVHQRSYIHLQNSTKPVSTLILGSYMEQTLDELKHTCRVSLDVLKMALVQPVVLAGGGCWQIHLAQYLKRKVMSNVSSWSRELCCSVHQLEMVTKAFTSSLEYVAMALKPGDSHVTDSANQHHWFMPKEALGESDWSNRLGHCGCGQMQNKDSTLNFRLIGEDFDFSSENLESVLSDNENESCSVFDLYSVWVSALATAVGTANMVLGIENFIQVKT